MQADGPKLAEDATRSVTRHMDNIDISYTHEATQSLRVSSSRHRCHKSTLLSLSGL